MADMAQGLFSYAVVSGDGGFGKERLGKRTGQSVRVKYKQGQENKDGRKTESKGSFRGCMGSNQEHWLQ